MVCVCPLTSERLGKHTVGNELPWAQKHYLLPFSALWKACLVIKLSFLFILVLYGLIGYSSVNRFWEESSELPFAMTV